jgi:hypothetical protein
MPMARFLELIDLTDTPAIQRKKWRTKADRDIVPSGDLGRAAHRL